MGLNCVIGGVQGDGDGGYDHGGHPRDDSANGAAAEGENPFHN
jgi:hypothetical protein